jgi:hypothetical protein
MTEATERVGKRVRLRKSGHGVRQETTGTVTISRGGVAVYDQVTAWIQVDKPRSWGGHLRAAEGHEFFVTSGCGRVLFRLKTVDGRGGQILITSVNTQTREVSFTGQGSFGPLRETV